MIPRLPDAAHAVFAKTRPALRRKPGEPSRPGDQLWLPLPQHLEDTAAVAAELLDRHTPAALVAQLARECGITSRQFRSTAIFLAAVHDVGKATPAFCLYDPQMLADMIAAHGFDSRLEPGSADVRDHGHHTVTGFFAVRDLLAQRGWNKAQAGAFAQVVGAHHGAPLTAEQVRDAGPDALPHLYGNHVWAEVRAALVDHWLARLSVAPHRIPGPVAFWLSGLVVNADWIASSTRHFPHDNLGDPRRTQTGIEAYGLPDLWRPAAPPGDAAEHLHRRFPHITSPHPAQVSAVEAAWAMTAPGVLLVEAPMGEGKTEAAFAAAEVLAAKFGAGGMIVALPTRATSDAMFTRTHEWTRHLPGGSADRTSLALGHGKARLNHDFQALPQAPEHTGRGPARYHSLEPSKRRLLSSFSVVTIDQLLVTVVKHRHQALRHLGLAGKVVVIDEVHAYDQWMSNHLDLLLGWLARYQVPVILLSATLPPGRRRSLLAAYTGADNALHHDQGYPLVIAASPGAEAQVLTPASSTRTLSVQTTIIGEDLRALTSAVRAASAAGANVLIVRNTVNRAQTLYTHLSGVLDPDKVELHHSRFIGLDRADNDKHLINRFGPPERMARKGYTRPSGQVVIATQVAEQSLDVDFDMLVTDLAPIDLVLQRLGRLHRHERPRPEGYHTPACLITGVRLAEDGPHYVPFPYRDLPMLAAADVLSNREHICLPGDIPILVRDAYDPNRAFPPAWQARAILARAQHVEDTKKAGDAAAWQLAPGDLSALFGLSRALNGGAETDAQAMNWVREAEPTLEALILVSDAEGKLHLPGWIRHRLAGAPVRRRHDQDADLADVAGRCNIPLPARLSTDEAAQELSGATPPAWKGTSLDLPLLVLDEAGRGTLAGYRISYTRKTGLAFAKG